MMDGYRPRLISEVVRLHIDYYSAFWNFGLPFEAKVASELSGFLMNFRDGEDFMLNDWHDRHHLKGTITLEAPGNAEGGAGGLAHLRWFIVDPEFAGEGLGKRLLDAALSHARERNFHGIYLTTFAGLGAARKLYESSGFCLTGESQVDQWSGGVREQRFELLLR